MYSAENSTHPPITKAQQINLMKEVFSILKYSFKTANKKVYVLAGIVGVILGVFMGGAMLMGVAAENDLNGEKVSHTACLVTEMPISYVSNGKMVTSIIYDLKTSCGDFKTNESLYKTMSLYGTYNLTATVGNWANKPTVVSAEIIVK